MSFTGETWPDAAVEMVRNNAGLNKSAREIAAALGEAGYAVTRCAVIGLCRRRGIALQGNSKDARKSRAKEEKTTRARARRHRPSRIAALNGAVLARLQDKPPILQFAETISEHPVSISQLTSQTCRWPLGGFAARPPFLFCGDQPLTGCPYCARHYWQSIKETNHATFRATETAA